MRAKHLVVALAVFAAVMGRAHPAAAAPLAEDTAEFVNPGFFVHVKEEFGTLPISPDMLLVGQSDPVTAIVEVYASTTYTIRIEMDNADLAGSQLNPGHPRGLDPRDAFLFSVTDSNGMPSPWHTGSQAVVITGQPATVGIGKDPARHRIELKLQFADADGDIFTAARPGTYTATFVIEVEEDAL